MESIHSTKFGDIPRATVEPPSVYSSIKAQPINQATLKAISLENHQPVGESQCKDEQHNLMQKEILNYINVYQSHCKQVYWMGKLNSKSAISQLCQENLSYKTHPGPQEKKTKMIIVTITASYFFCFEIPIKHLSHNPER